MRRPALLFALASLSLLSCVDADPAGPGFPAISTASESSTILDGANGGNPHFFFLPPLVKNPKTQGELNTALLPSVEICALREDGVGCAETQPDGLPIVFSSGTGQDGVRLTGRHYSANWQTGDYDLDAATNYRVRVFAVAGGAPLGHIDVDILGKGENAASGLLGVKQGSTLPIRFRVEEGASCTFGIDCIEAVVGPAGGTVVTPAEFAGVEIPPGALDGSVLIIIERIDVSVTPCLPTDIQQAEGCYRYDTEPALSEVQLNEAGEFNEDVLVGICLDPDVLALPEHHEYALHKYDPEQAEPNIVQLPTAAVTFLECEGFEALAFAETNRLLHLARAGWEQVAPVVQWFAPGRAHAVNLGFGGVVRSFSQIGWARGVALELVNEEDFDDLSGLPGAALPIEPTVRATATHWDPDEFDGAPTIPGVVVTFTFTDADNNVTEVQAITNSDGFASVPWVLGATPGVNTLAIAGATTGAVGVEVTGTLPEGLVPDQVVAGANFTCALDEDGFAYCWGGNGSGQLGNGTTEPSLTPVPVGEVEFTPQFTSLSAGDIHVCGIATDEQTYCWGNNSTGQLGIGGTTSQTIPQAVTGSFVSISAGLRTTCAVTGGNQAYCWGANEYGQLGSTTEETCGVDEIPCSSTPVLVGVEMSFQSISTGAFHTCGVTTGGAGYCWGENSGGQLGSDTEGAPSTTPLLVEGDLTFSSISAGGFESCSVAFNEGWCWGENQYGQLGNGSFDGGTEPAEMTIGSALGTIELSNKNTLLAFGCALGSDNALYCWGANQFGQLGVGSAAMETCTFVENFFPCSPEPVQVSGTWSAVTVGREHVCAIDFDGALYCWGSNGDGQFGDGTTESSNVPKLIPFTDD